jgi:hypothetical protein
MCSAATATSAAGGLLSNLPRGVDSSASPQSRKSSPEASILYECQRARPQAPQRDKQPGPYEHWGETS